jgi:hypothetical protein
MIAYSIAEGIGIERSGQDSWVTILTLSSMRPWGVGHEEEEAGEVESDQQGEGGCRGCCYVDVALTT